MSVLGALNQRIPRWIRLGIQYVFQEYFCLFGRQLQDILDWFRHADQLHIAVFMI
jgi:hypothetical protein